MKKDLAAVLPNYEVADVPIITISGYDEPGELKAPSSLEDNHCIPFDVVEGWYAESGDLTIDIPKKVVHLPTDDFGRTIDLSEKVKKPKKKEKKQKNSKKELIQRLLANYEEDEKTPAAMKIAFPPEIQKGQGFLSEDNLYGILTKKYRFGCYGSDLYVRGTNGVYSLVNIRTVDRLLMALPKEQLGKFKISTAQGVLRRLKASEEITENQLIFPKTKILMENGCFDLLTKKPAKINDSDFFVCRIKAKYLPGEKLFCPNFDRYLETSSGGDESIKRRICAMLGYLMLSGYPGKKILVLGVAKNSGKSMIARFYQRLVGPELVCGQTPFDMSETHALSEFLGMIANMPMDIPAAYIKPPSVGTMKVVSGNDLVSVNPKNQDRRSVNCYTKQVLGTNAPIRLQQYDEAFWERIEIIPYIHSIDTNDRIDNLEDLLFEERDAIVTKCLKAARDLLKNNYEFPPCPVAEKMKNAWIGWNQHAKKFLLTNCVVEEGAYTHSSQLYDTYVQYCQDHALPYGSQKAFICYAKGLFPSDGNPHRMINGVQLRGLPDVRFLGEY